MKNSRGRGRLAGRSGAGEEVSARIIRARANRAWGPLSAGSWGLVEAELMDVVLFGREAPERGLGKGLLGQATPEATHLIKVACECGTEQREGMSVVGTDYDTRDGTCIRDYIHVEDLAKAHVMALDYMADSGHAKVMNCGYGRGFTVREVIDVVKEQSGVDFPVTETGRRAGDPAALMADNTLIRQTLGWQPDHDDLDTIVGTALAWEAIWQKKKADDTQ